MLRTYSAADFDFHLPESSIAQFPLPERSASRLLCVARAPLSSGRAGFEPPASSGGWCSHKHFKDILDLIEPRDLLVFNNTKVIPARLWGEKTTGGKVECLVERLLSDTTCLAHLRANKSPKKGSRILFEKAFEMEVLDRERELFKLQSNDSLPAQLERYGKIPLPPYIKRLPEISDKERYQTVYAKAQGAVAAPTAGLHFDEPLLKAFSEKGVNRAEVTLHVGAGTFQPLRDDNIEVHNIHSEIMILRKEVCEKIEQCKSRGGRVIAVGTTSVRAIETAALKGALAPYEGETTLFIKPGFEFRVVDAIITNFHLPESTLLMLVAAFGGYEKIMVAYQEAVQAGYRFYSYGDSMFIY